MKPTEQKSIDKTINDDAVPFFNVNFISKQCIFSINLLFFFKNKI